MSEAQLFDGVTQGGLQPFAAEAQGDAVAEPAARHVREIVNQGGHMIRASGDGLRNCACLVVQLAAEQECCTRADGDERIAKIVTKHRDRLMVQRVQRKGVGKSSFGFREPHASFLGIVRGVVHGGRAWQCARRTAIELARFRAVRPRAMQHEAVSFEGVSDLPRFDAVMLVTAHADETPPMDRLVNAGFIIEKATPVSFVDPRAIAVGAQTAVAGGKRLLLALHETCDERLWPQRFALLVEGTRVLDLDLTALLACVEVGDDRAQCGARLVRVERCTGYPQATLVVLKTRPKEGNNKVAQICGRTVKLTDMASPSEGRQRRDAGWRVVVRGIFLHPCNLADAHSFGMMRPLMPLCCGWYSAGCLQPRNRDHHACHHQYTCQYHGGVQSVDGIACRSGDERTEDAHAECASNLARRVQQT